MLLPQEEKIFFDDFIKHINKKRKQASSRVSCEVGGDEEAYAYLILFGEIQPKMRRFLTEDICIEFRGCKDCKQFSSKRCLKFVSEKYDDTDTKRILNKSNWDRRFGDYYFFKNTVKRLESSSSWYSKACDIVGRYRVELFCHYWQEKAKQSFTKFKNKDNAPKEEIKERQFLPAYCTAEYIENNDNWLQFKALSEEEDFLCSVLSDF